MTSSSSPVVSTNSETLLLGVRRFLCSERLYRSFYRNVPLPEEIIPSKVTARIENGILRVELPKKTPTESKAKVTRVDALLGRLSPFLSYYLF